MKRNKFSNKTPETMMAGPSTPIFDCLVHAVDFTQKEYPLEDLIRRMDETNVVAAAVCGLPVQKAHIRDERIAPAYYLDDEAPCYYSQGTDLAVAKMYERLDQESKDRLFPLICGFNPTDRRSIDYVEGLFAKFPGTFCGIGEILFRHDDLTLMTYGEVARPDNVAMYPIYEFAAKHGLPIVIHQNITSVGTKRFPKYLYEIEQVFRKFPRTKFQFTHCGISRRLDVPNYPKIIDRLLSEYDNLSVDFSWVFFDEVLRKDGLPDKEWIDLAKKHSDRIMVGSDNVGHYSKMGPENAKFDILFDMLDKKTIDRIARENAFKMYEGTRFAVESGKTFSVPKMNDIF